MQFRHKFFYGDVVHKYQFWKAVESDEEWMMYIEGSAKADTGSECIETLWHLFAGIYKLNDYIGTWRWSYTSAAVSKNLSAYTI
jgi:hypothetical protein